MSFKLRLTYSKNVDWKDKKQMVNTIIPANSFPDTNSNAPDFKPRPIKHWRKQLIPSQSGGFSNSVINFFDTPGGTIIKTDSENCNCDESNNSSLLYTYIPHKPLESRPQFYEPIEDDYDISNNRCRACNPEAHVIKSATTIVNKNYYTDSRAYLRSRCKTYDQKIVLSKKTGVTYLDSNNNPIAPSNDPNGSQVFNTNCYNDKCPAVATTIYKPNNKQFAQQGATSSSSRVAKLKYDTITKNGNSFTSAWGASAANAGRYLGTTEAPFFIKSKYQQPICHIKSGRSVKYTSDCRTLVPVA